MDSVLVALMPVLALALIVACHLALSRLQPNRLPWRSLAVASAIGLAFSVTITVVLSTNAPLSEVTAYVLVNIGATAALAFGYFNFVNLNYTSLRVRMLRELLGSREGFSLDDLRARYDADAVLDLRLNRLIEARQLRLEGSRYRLGESRNVLMIGRALALIKSILIPHDSGARDG